MAENKWSKATPVILFYFLSIYQNNASIKDRLKLQYVRKNQIQDFVLAP